MCHHYIIRAARNGSWNPEWDNEFSLRSNLYQLPLPELGFYPLAMTPIIRLDRAGEREMVAAQWGFLPAWWKPSEKTTTPAAFQRKCINARSEEVDAKPTYRDAFRRRRCLMPAEEFFERGHYFHLADRRPFAFAALWESWRDAGDEVVESCTLLTTEPNEAVRAVGHNRMPVVLSDKTQYARWLDPERPERAAVEDLLTPSPADWWTAYLAPAAPRPPAQGRLF